jgi:hypothetical protein
MRRKCRTRCTAQMAHVAGLLLFPRLQALSRSCVCFSFRLSVSTRLSTSVNFSSADFFFQVLLNSSSVSVAICSAQAQIVRRKRFHSAHFLSSRQHSINRGSSAYSSIISFPSSTGPPCLTLLSLDRFTNSSCLLDAGPVVQFRRDAPKPRAIHRIVLFLPGAVALVNCCSAL